MPRKITPANSSERSSAVDRGTADDWHARFRNPALTILLILEVCLIFFAAPLAAKGLPVAKPIIETMVLTVIAVVAMLSRRPGAIVVILVGMAAILASLSLGSNWPAVVKNVVHRSGDMLVFTGLTWLVAHAVYAPGRITLHRLQGAVVVYLNAATIFAAAFSLILELNPNAFTSPPAANGDLGRLATMLYFSLSTLTTTGYGDIVPVDPFARSLSNLESVIGPLYLAMTIARLVTMELEDRRR